MAAPFSELADHPWSQVSPRLTTGRLLVFAAGCMGGGLLAAAAALIALVDTEVSALWAFLPLALAGLVMVWATWWVPRNRKSWAYCEQPDELLIRRGVLFRRLISVPYGRMQFVDLQAGPIARRLGYDRLTLHTASTKTAATIPGVPHSEAARLRRQLTELGQAHGAGL